jgi:hypothetical protein
VSCINPYFLKPHQLAADARLFVDREALMRSLPRASRVAELGVLFGLNAQFILEELCPAELHLLDVDFSLLAGGPDRPEGWRASLPLPEHPPMIREHPAVTLHEGDGADSLMNLGSLDWVYVDGHHGYESAYRDGGAAMSVAPIVVFNDYTNYSIIEREEYGVMTAVNQLLTENPGWEVFAMGLQRDGYHDLAIRRRA